MPMKDKVVLRTDKIKREKKASRNLKIALLVILLVVVIIYFVIGIVYNSGNFSITLDRNLYYDKGIIIYEEEEYKVYRSELLAETPETFDNINYNWLPADIDEHEGGAHNGENYLAYTFYIENIGEEVADYWSEVVIDDVIKDVDEAVRIRIYRDGEYVTYAKESETGQAEEGTTKFSSEELVVREHVEGFEPGSVSKYTIVMWIEGTDPECTDNILGGEFKVHMEFNSEYVEK